MRKNHKQIQLNYLKSKLKSAKNVFLKSKYEIKQLSETKNDDISSKYDNIYKNLTSSILSFQSVIDKIKSQPISTQGDLKEIFPVISEKHIINISKIINLANLIKHHKDKVNNVHLPININQDTKEITWPNWSGTFFNNNTLSIDYDNIKQTLNYLSTQLTKPVHKNTIKTELPEDTTLKKILELEKSTTCQQEETKLLYLLSLKNRNRLLSKGLKLPSHTHGTTLVYLSYNTLKEIHNRVKHHLFSSFLYENSVWFYTTSKCHAYLIIKNNLNAKISFDTIQNKILYYMGFNDSDKPVNAKLLTKAITNNIKSSSTNQEKNIKKKNKQNMEKLKKDQKQALDQLKEDQKQALDQLKYTINSNNNLIDQNSNTIINPNKEQIEQEHKENKIKATNKIALINFEHNQKTNLSKKTKEFKTKILNAEKSNLDKIFTQKKNNPRPSLIDGKLYHERRLSTLEIKQLETKHEEKVATINTKLAQLENDHNTEISQLTDAKNQKIEEQNQIIAASKQTRDNKLIQLQKEKQRRLLSQSNNQRPLNQKQQENRHPNIRHSNIMTHPQYPCNPRVTLNQMQHLQYPCNPRVPLNQIQHLQYPCNPRVPLNQMQQGTHPNIRHPNIMTHPQYPYGTRVPLNQMQQENRHPNILGQHQPCYIRKRMPMNSHSSHMQNQQVRTNVLYPNNPAKTNWHYPNHPVRPNGKTFYQRTPSQQQGYPQQRMYSGQQVHSTRSRNFR